jgi:hypothetical protein
MRWKVEPEAGFFNMLNRMFSKEEVICDLCDKVHEDPFELYLIVDRKVMCSRCRQIYKGLKGAADYKKQEEIRNKRLAEIFK